MSQNFFIHVHKNVISVFFECRTYTLFVILISSFTGSVFQAGSEWPSSGYKATERGLLIDFGFNSTPLVIMFALFTYSVGKDRLYMSSCLPLINVETMH